MGAGARAPVRLARVGRREEEGRRSDEDRLLRIQQSAFGRVIAGFIIVAAVPAFAGEGKPSAQSSARDPGSIPAGRGPKLSTAATTGSMCTRNRSSAPRLGGFHLRAHEQQQPHSGIRMARLMLHLRHGVPGRTLRKPARRLALAFMVGPDLIATAEALLRLRRHRQRPIRIRLRHVGRPTPS